MNLSTLSAQLHKSSAEPPEPREIKNLFLSSLLRHIQSDRKTCIHCISGILVGGILEVECIKAGGVDAEAPGPQIGAQRSPGEPGLSERVLTKAWEEGWLSGLGGLGRTEDAEPGPVPTHWVPGLAEPLKHNHVWSIITRSEQRAPRLPQWEDGCPLADCTRNLVRKARGTKTPVPSGGGRWKGRRSMSA